MCHFESAHAFHRLVVVAGRGHGLADNKTMSRPSSLGPSVAVVDCCFDATHVRAHPLRLPPGAPVQPPLPQCGLHSHHHHHRHHQSDSSNCRQPSPTVLLGHCDHVAADVCVLLALDSRWALSCGKSKAKWRESRLVDDETVCLWRSYPGHTSAWQSRQDESIHD